MKEKFFKHTCTICNRDFSIAHESYNSLYSNDPVACPECWMKNNKIEVPECPPFQELIAKIGDQEFMLVPEDEQFGPNSGYEITDCEGETTISVKTSDETCKSAAEALMKILNGEFKD